MEKYQERNLEGGHVLLFGEITEERAEKVVEQVLYLEGKRKGRPKEVCLWIHSSGGLLQPALALSDLFDNIRLPVRTIGLGTVESAAAYLLMAGTKGRRMLSRYASIMVHEFSWNNSGSYTEMKGRSKEIEQTLKRQIEFVCERTGLPARKVRKLLKHAETWLTPDEALEWKLIDEIYGS